MYAFPHCLARTASAQYSQYLPGAELVSADAERLKQVRTHRAAAEAVHREQRRNRSTETAEAAGTHWWVTRREAAETCVHTRNAATLGQGMTWEGSELYEEAIERRSLADHLTAVGGRSVGVERCGHE